MLKSNKIFILFLLFLLIPFISYVLLDILNLNSTFNYLFVTSLLILVTLVYIYKFFKYNEQTQQKLVQEFKITLKEKSALEKHSQIKDIMLQISYSIIDIRNIDEILNIVVNSVTEIIDKADTANIILKNKNGIFEYKAVSKLSNPNLLNLKLDHHETLSKHWTDQNPLKSKVINFQEDSFDNGSSLYCSRNKESIKDGIKSTLSTPVIIDGNFLGLINVNNKSHVGAFTEEDIAIVEYLTAQLSLAIKNLQLLEKTIYLSRYDGLTGVYHRHYFDELFNNIHSRALRYNESFCLCAIDLDNLKNVNDLYGHGIGDIVIKNLIEVLKKNIRDSDILGRYGGDEFIVIFLNSQIEDVLLKLQDIVKELSKAKVKYENKLLNISFSYGVASFPNDSTDSKELFKIADSRMYNFKSRAKALND